MIVESVGLGQSEVDIDAAVDMLVLLVPPGGGDSLQAAKKGIMEAADLVLVNKADGPLLAAAKHTKADYAGAMQFIRRKHGDWQASVLMISAQSGLHMDEVEERVAEYLRVMRANKYLWGKRSNQAKHWMREHFRRLVLAEVESTPIFKQKLGEISSKLENDLLPARVAANELYSTVRRSQ